MIAEILLISTVLNLSNWEDKGSELKLHGVPQTKQEKLLSLRIGGDSRPFYVISKSVVADSLLRERLGRALVTVYMGDKWWPKDESAFSDSEGTGIRVLLAASREIENDDGTAAVALRKLGPKGCAAMLESLKGASMNGLRVDQNFIEELGNARFLEATDVLVKILSDRSAVPEARVAAAKSLTQFGNRKGLRLLKAMRLERNSSAWKEWIDEEVKRIERPNLRQ